MVPRKKKAMKKSKQTRATKEHSSKPLVEQAMSNDSSIASSTQEIAGPIEASMTDASLSSADDPVTAPAAIKPTPKAVAQTQCPLFLLPTEVRLMIYKYVFKTGIVDKDTGARIHAVGEPESKHYFALLKTCRAIHSESKPFVIPKFVLRFPSPTAYATFLCGDLNSPQFLAQNYDRLEQAGVQVQVVVTTERLSYNPMKILLRNAEQYLDPVFVEEEAGDDTTSEALSQARFSWAYSKFNRGFHIYGPRIGWML
ncbi:hypothetical protein KCU65_g5708, partial [Aureobasidium melanogenum]